MATYLISIPTNEQFVRQWHNWIFNKVNRHFKRDKERVPDTVQNVILRLLSKDFIGRWFFKHLTDELVNREDAERILGGAPLTYISYIKPVSGKRSDKDSLWRISDLLAYGKFDYGRYYYSCQGHTVDTAKVLHLLGYGPDDFGSLQSLYRQNRLFPAEMTEHFCSGKKCIGCENGRETLRLKGLSLASHHNWNSLKVKDAVLNLRWNDLQLKNFLRDWRHMNKVKAVPKHLVRPTNHGIDAGLLKYAQMVIDHEVVNDFKRISRADDTSIGVFNKGMSPELGNEETVAWEAPEDGEEKSDLIIRDTTSMRAFGEFEKYRDLYKLISMSELTSEESEVLQGTDLAEISVRSYAKNKGVPISQINKIRESALGKIRSCSSF